MEDYEMDYEATNYTEKPAKGKISLLDAKNISKRILKNFAKRTKWQNQLFLGAMCAFFDPSLVHYKIN